MKAGSRRLKRWKREEKEEEEKKKKTGRAGLGYQGAPLFVIPPDSPPPSPLAPADRTHWPVFNKAPVLGRFLSSSINCSREVTQGRERAREIESRREGEREAEKRGTERTREMEVKGGGGG